ncbi:hypothetical protein NE857_34055 (plasmid) [Nocardiopsis exhalans]|uniref:Uncharacterized protein n=1 Tax=Nocardiopsis exhalans TaxID=163604 RepID=A0ABY5DJN3_9ACTN|nr:hypothetical protein [Nocardiopsis exhalans]USY23558.1 hypothetical protein NE857_34055 [Nocardiopsis exhalans]
MSTPESDSQAMADLYERGYTSYEIGAAFGLDSSTVRDRLREMGVEIRRTGTRLRSDVSTEEIVHLVDQVGLSYQRAGQLVGMSRTGARARYLRHHYGYGWRWSPPHIQGTLPNTGGRRISG